VWLLHCVAAIALLFADELASRPEAMCSPVAADPPTVADRIASGALRRRTRGSRQQRQGTLMQPRNYTDGNMQLAVAMSLSLQETKAVELAASQNDDSYHVREEIIDLRSDDEADEVEDTGVGGGDGRRSTTTATQRSGYRQLQRGTSDSISDATIERLTGLSLS
jgi:hypothetical protein